MKRIGQCIQTVRVTGTVRQPAQQQTEYAQLFVKRRVPQFGSANRLPGAGKQLIHAVNLLVFVIKLQIIRKIACHLRQLQILLHNLTINRNTQRLVHLHQLGQILPAARSDELQAIGGGLHAVEMLAPDLEIGQNRAVDAASVRILLPHAEILFDVDFFDAIECYHVKFPHGFVVFRRISGRYDHPSCRQLLVAEGLALQKLQHHRRECLGNAVDLIEEQNALFDARAFHFAVHRSDNLAHCVGGDGAFLAAEHHLVDERQTERGLARVVRQRVGDKADAGLLGNLLHNLRFADARRSHQQDWPLPNRRNAIRAEFIGREIRLERVFDFVFCSLYVHDSSSNHSN